MSTVDRSQTSFYAKVQSGKGSVATVAAGDAIEITYDSNTMPVKVMGNPVERNIIRSSRLPNKRLIVGEWGEGQLGVELHGSGSVGTAPEYGLLIKSLLGQEAVVPATSVTYSITDAGDTSWLTFDSYVDGVRTLCTDGRCRSWSVNAEAGEIVNQTFMLKSLTAADSDATDPNTPSIDGVNPMVASSMTFTIGGASKNCKSVEFTVENPKQDLYINNAGIGDLPEDSALTIEGTIRIEAVDISPFTALFNTTTQDIVVAATDGTETATFTLADCQYSDNIEAEDDEGTVIWSIPFVATGGVTLAIA